MKESNNFNNKNITAKPGEIFITTDVIELECLTSKGFENFSFSRGAIFIVKLFGKDTEFQAFKKGTLVFYNEDNDACIPVNWSERVINTLEKMN